MSNKYHENFTWVDWAICVVLVFGIATLVVMIAAHQGYLLPASAR